MFGELTVALRAFIEGAAVDLAAKHGLLEVGDLLGALIEQEDDEGDFFVIVDDALGDVLEHHRLSRARGGIDETALTFAQRGNEVHDARGDGADGFRYFKDNALLREGGGKLLEVSRRLVNINIDAVHLGDAVDGEVFVLVLRRAGDACDAVARAEGELADEEEGDEDVLRQRGKAVFGIANEAEILDSNLKDAFNKHTRAVIRHPGEHVVDELVFRARSIDFVIHAGGEFSDLGEAHLMERIERDFDREWSLRRRRTRPLRLRFTA